MDTLIEIAVFLIRVFASLYLAVILLRFMLQAARADFYNPVSQFLVKFTNPVLIPLRRIIPGFWGIDFASIVLAVLFHWLAMQLVLIVAGYGLVPPHYMIAWAFIGIALNMITLYLIAGFVLFITSFLAPYSQNPVLLLVRQLLEPLMAPIRRYIPPVGGLDFSLFFVSIFLMVMRILVEGISQSINTPLSYLIGFA